MPSCKHTDYLRIRSWSDAKIAFENTAPIRGEDKCLSGVPLERSRRAHRTKFLSRHTSPDGEVSFRLHLYYTSVVTYHQDGRVTLDLSYTTVSTAGFANALTPPDVHVRLERGNMVVRCLGTGEFIANGTVTLRRAVGGDYVPDGTPQRYYDKLNLSRAAQARKQIRPLLDYLHTIEALTPISREAYAGMRAAIPSPLDVENPDHFPAIAASLLQHGPRGLAYIMPPDWKSAFLRRVYGQLGCYDRTPVPYGTVRHDSYTVNE